MSDDLLNQHAAISDLQQAEEILVDQHKAINEFLAQLLPESRELYNMTNSVEYDQDGKYRCFELLCPHERTRPFSFHYKTQFLINLTIFAGKQCTANAARNFSRSWPIWQQRVEI